VTRLVTAKNEFSKKGEIIPKGIGSRLEKSALPQAGEGEKEDQLRMQDRVIYLTAGLPFAPGALAGGEGAGGMRGKTLIAF
jgi:hypothetical protein